jgi:hypothetical protein
MNLVLGESFGMVNSLGATTKERTSDAAGGSRVVLSAALIAQKSDW